jgi:hypothetical protein
MVNVTRRAPHARSGGCILVTGFYGAGRTAAFTGHTPVVDQFSNQPTDEYLIAERTGFAIKATVHENKIRRWQTFTPPQSTAHAAHCGLVLHWRAYLGRSRITSRPCQT